MLIRPLFQRYKKYIAAFANTSFGKAYLDDQIQKTSNKILDVRPDGWEELLDVNSKEQIIRSTNYSRSPFLKKLGGALIALRYAEQWGTDLRAFYDKTDLILPHYLGLVKPLAYLPSLRQLQFPYSSRLKCNYQSVTYPNADTETTTCDGKAARREVTEYQPAIRSGNGTEGGASAGELYCDFSSCPEGTPANTFRDLSRIFFLFDLSAVDFRYTRILTTTKFSFYPTYTANTWSPEQGWCVSLGLYNSYPASNTDVVASDYQGNVNNNTLYSNTYYQEGNAAINAYYDFPLNTAGLATIIQGVIKIGMKSYNDALDSFPNAYKGRGANTFFWTADHGSLKPKLTVDYSRMFGRSAALL